MEEKRNLTQLENHDSIVRTRGCLSGPKKKTRGGAQNRRNWKFTHVPPPLTAPHLRPSTLPWPEHPPLAGAPLPLSRWVSSAPRPARAGHGSESSRTLHLPPRARHATPSSSSQFQLQNLCRRFSLAELRSSTQPRIKKQGPQGKITCFQG